MNSPLEVTLNRYQTVLKNLDNPHLEEEQILEILSVRDVLHKQLENEEEIPINLCSKLVEQDAKLKKNASRIAKITNFDNYRNTLSISEKGWWWYLDSQHPISRFDGLWRVIKLLLLGVNFALIGSIIRE